MARTPSATIRKATTPEATTPEAADELNALELHALANIGKRAQRDALAPGNGQAVDVTIHLAGAINVGEDGTPAAHTKPDAALLLAVALEQLGEGARQKILNAIAGRFAAFVADGTPPEAAEDAAKAVAELLATLTHHGTAKRRGTVTAALKATVLRRGPATAALKATVLRRGPATAAA